MASFDKFVITALVFVITGTVASGSQFDVLQHLGGNGQWFPGIHFSWFLRPVSLTFTQAPKSLVFLPMFQRAAQSTFLHLSPVMARGTRIAAPTMDGTTSTLASKRLATSPSRTPSSPFCLHGSPYWKILSSKLRS
jgi:hypothetical protein